MEEELNYLSEKIETISQNINTYKYHKIGSWNFAVNKLKHEKILLENIFKKLTQIELEK